MTLIKSGFKFIFSKYNLIVSILLIGLFFAFKFIVSIPLDVANVTWIYSSSMQTLAALIALLPISYGYYITNLDNEKNDELDSYIVEKLKSDVYYNMMTVIIYSLLVIIVNLFSFFVNYTVDFALIVALLTIEGIGLISIYIYRLFDPNRVKEVLKEFDTSTVDPNQKTVSLDTFITEYLELETAVKDFISNENDNELIDALPLYDIVDNLSKDFPEINEHFDTFKEIIFHRNNLIHNYTDTIVDYSKYEKIIDLKDMFTKYNNAFVQKNIFNNVTKVKNNIEICLKEYLGDLQNKTEGFVDENLKEEVVSLLHSYFISDYYVTLSLDDASDTDFEIIQNNYSERKLVGIDVKSILPKSIKPIATAFFNRLDKRFVYLFIVNYDVKLNAFTIYYRTKDKEIKTTIIK